MISLELYPKNLDDKDYKHFLEVVKTFNPEFVSVTMPQRPLAVNDILSTVEYLLNAGLKVIPHITAANSTESQVRGYLEHLILLGIDSVMVITGDNKRIGDTPVFTDFKNGSDLLSFIRANYQSLSVYTSFYPDAVNCEGLIAERKQYSSNFISQMVFDIDAYKRTHSKLKALYPECSFRTGFMPIISKDHLIRWNSLPNLSMPADVFDLITKEQFVEAAWNKSVSNLLNLLQVTEDIHIFTMDNAAMLQELFYSLKRD